MRDFPRATIPPWFRRSDLRSDSWTPMESIGLQKSEWQEVVKRSEGLRIAILSGIFPFQQSRISGQFPSASSRHNRQK
jgi:hypothetical protein